MKYKILITLCAICLMACSKSSSESSMVAIDQSEPNATVIAGSVEDEKSAEDVVAVQVEAEVLKVDKGSRMVSLQGPDGNKLEVQVGDKVERFNEINVGDTVIVDYLQSVAYEVRAPTESELRSPRSQVEVVGRATEELPPGAEVIRASRSIVTVVAIDKERQTISVRVPAGNVKTVNVRVPERLDKVKVGDTIAVTFTEAVAISLEKKNAAS